MMIEGLNKYFTTERNWTIIPVSSNKVDVRDTNNDAIRCIDYRYGIMPDGSYDPDSVPRSPAWLGALDGISAFLEGDAEQRHQKAAEMVRDSGFRPADHGDIVGGDIKGCKFKLAQLEGKFPDLSVLSIEETRVLRAKIGVEHFTLNPTTKHPDGFILNPNMYTTVLPNDAQFYPIDIWYPDYLGIEPERFFPVIERCGELLLPADARILYVLTS